MAPLCGLQPSGTVRPGSRPCGYPQVTESYTHDGALCTQASQVIHRHSVDSDLSTSRTNGSWSMAWPSTLGVLAAKGRYVDQDDGAAGPASIMDVTKPLSPEQERRLALLDAVPIQDETTPPTAQLAQVPDP